jgi:ComF family protein
MFKYHTKKFKLSLPQRCLFCIEWIKGDPQFCENVCDTCWHTQAWIKNKAQDAHLSLGSKTNPTELQRYVLCPFFYDAHIRKLILNFKEKGSLVAFDFFIQAMLCTFYDLYEKNLAPQALVAIPLHPIKQKQRGFNQSQVLAQALSRILNIPTIDEQLIIRQHHTQKQATLKSTDRLRNSANAFKVNNPNALKKFERIAIVDDILTTGSTCQSLAGTLLKHQQLTIDIWAIAKTPEQASKQPNISSAP